MKEKKNKELKAEKNFNKPKLPKVKKKRRNFIKEIFIVDNKFDFKALIKNILIPLGGGFLVSLLTRGGMNTYSLLKKPNFTPPEIVFPIVWTVLYILMGIAAYRIYMNNKEGKKDGNAYFCYLIQLAINFLWAIVFFNLKLYGIAFILLLILLAFIVLTTIKFFKIDKIAGCLMIPYILWVSFAGVLSFYIWMLNEM